MKRQALPQRLIGFTLVELLVVTAVMVLLIGLAGLGITKVMSASLLSQGGQMVGDTLAMARQEAVSRNREVQVVFFELPNPDSTKEWRAIQLWTVQETVNGQVLKPLGKPIILPQGVKISPNPNYSPLLTADTSISLSAESSKPRTLNGYPDANYAGFRILPSGSLDKAITPATNFVSLQQRTDSGEPPQNYYCLQMNPVTGSVKIYRP